MNKSKKNEAKKKAEKKVVNALTKALDDVITENEKKVKKSKPITATNIPVPVEEKVKKERKKRISKWDPERVEEKFQKALPKINELLFGKET